MSEFTETLKSRFGPQSVVTEITDLSAYLVDWRGLWTGKPRAVLRPKTPQEAAEMISVCAQENVGIVPQGGQTGLCGGALPDQSGTQVVITAERLNTIRSVDALNNTVTADAGCTLAQLQQTAATHNRLFPLSLASEGSCHIGGNIATNAGGVHVLKYGNTRDLVLGLEAVLPDGRIWSDMTSLRKNNVGYDLKHLFIGSEGSIGFITGAVLKLFPKPSDTTVIFAAVKHPQGALNVFHKMQDTFGSTLSAAELIPRLGLECVIKHIPQCRDPFERPAPWYMLFEVEHQHAPNDLSEDLAPLIEKEDDILDMVISISQAQAQNLWRLRESLSEAQKYEGGSIKHDISVPVSAVPAFLEVGISAVEAWLPGIRPIPFGHLGDGNIHFNLSQPQKMETSVFLDKWAEANRIVHDLVADFDGSISAEHGIGQLKQTELTRYMSDVHQSLLHTIKTTLDPNNIMNPGKVLPMKEN